MKLINRTHWRASDLRRIAGRVCREEFPSDRFGSRSDQITVVVGYNRTTGTQSSGYAHFHSNTAYVNVPSGTVDPVDFAHVTAHEFGHCKGLTHDRMPPHMRSTTVAKRSQYMLDHFAWAAAFPIRRIERRATAKPTAAGKLAHAKRMRDKARTRAKRAATLLKKWEKKVKYYEAKANAHQKTEAA